VAAAQAAREAALAEREKAQQQEAEARKNEAEAQKREAEQARRVARRTLAGLAAAIILALIAGSFAIYAFNERDQAQKATETANEQRDLAEKAARAANEQRDQAQFQESRALAILSRAASNAGDQPTAMLLALYALPDPGFGGKRPLSFDAAAALDLAWMRNRETALVAPGELWRDNCFAKIRINAILFRIAGSRAPRRREGVRHLEHNLRRGWI